MIDVLTTGLLPTWGVRDLSITADRPSLHDNSGPLLFVSNLTCRPASLLTPQVPDWKQEGEPDAPDELDLTAEDLIVTGQLQRPPCLPVTHPLSVAI